MTNVATKLKELRERKCVSYADVAMACNTSACAIEQYETTDRVPRDEIKKRLAQYYGTTVFDLFFRKEN